MDARGLSRDGPREDNLVPEASAAVISDGGRCRGGCMIRQRQMSGRLPLGGSVVQPAVKSQIAAYVRPARSHHTAAVSGSSPQEMGTGSR